MWRINDCHFVCVPISVVFFLFSFLSPNPWWIPLRNCLMLFLQSNIVDLRPLILHSDPNHPVQFTCPSNEYAVLILISLIALYRSFCVYCIHFPFNSITFSFNSIENVHSNFYWCSLWSVWVCLYAVWRWRLIRVQDRYWSYVRNVYVVCWFIYVWISYVFVFDTRHNHHVNKWHCILPTV